jgi:aminoglycoside phosphotransferase
VIAGTPSEPVAVPAPLAALAGPARLTPVRRNQLGGLTWQLGDRPQRRFVTWAPAGSGLDLASEVERLRWADPAVATWTTGWNYGPGWESRLLAAYGVDADPDRLAYYRLLWDGRSVTGPLRSAA